MTIEKGDPSRGWEAVASELIHGRARRAIGAATIWGWTEDLPPGAIALDLGCGAGVPVTQVLVDRGCKVYGIDASPTLVQAWREHFPEGKVLCEAVETSLFFQRQFHAITAIGLLFLLEADEQAQLITKVGAALLPQGRFLFNAPTQEVSWNDALTGRESRSLGEARYRQLLGAAGMEVEATFSDEGESHYFAAIRVR
jgi:2-polyprenyl-3-methyl-5-hydroxy-6-metoxy-1,4-benzoquinol methylase